MKKDVVEALDKTKLFQTAKRFGIKTSKLSLMQIREALVKAGDEPPKKEKKPKADGPRPGSKVARCLELYKDNIKLPRKDIIELFLKKGGLTSKAAASTYFQNIKSKYGTKA
ncbi:MAG: hypothetical protein ACJ8R9_10775 [Steroidobacteraceae bacterium]